MALAAAGIAGASAAAAYIDAKYHVRKDLADITERRKTRRIAQKRAQQDRRSLWYDFEDRATELPEEQCLWYRTSPTDQAATYTWRQTYEHCCRFAQFLLQNNVRPGELIATYLINSPEFVFNLVGSWSIACAPALINYNLGGDGLLHCLKIAKSKVVIVDEDEGCQARIAEVKDRIEELGMKVIVLDAATKASIAALAPERPGDEYRAGLKGEFPIFLFNTSGTTGMPKACAFQTQRAYGLGFGRARTTGLKTGSNADTWYDTMPMYHGTGCTVVVACMIGGIRLAIGRKFSVRNFWQDVHDSEANCFVYVGETARYLLNAPPSPLDKDHKLKAMYGNGMRPDVWPKFVERFNIPCVNEFFNSTEGMFSLLNVCTGPFHAAHVGHQGGLQRYSFRDTYVPVEPDHENSDRIWRDPKTGFAKRNSFDEGGEILVQCQSKQEFVGYWNNPEATEKRFERDVFRKGDLWYKTGDALRRDADGRWFFLDRLGDTYRWKSENVSTSEVAEVLGRFPQIDETNVYGVAVPNADGKAGCAAIYIQPAYREKFDWKGLLEHARKGMPKYAVPIFVRVVAMQSPMHNNNQNKVPLRKEGIDPRKIREGEAGKEDEMFWVPPGGDRYVPFSEGDLDGIVSGKARL